MKLIFEMGAPGRGCDLIPPCTTPESNCQKYRCVKKRCIFQRYLRQSLAATIPIWQNRLMASMMDFIP